MKILILGHGRHGKDTIAEQIAKEFDLSFISSSLFLAESLMMEKLEYETSEECFNDRHNKRSVWFESISEYNSPDKSRITREILAENDIYVGLRADDEYQASKHLFDLVIWVDASQRLPLESHDSFNIKFNPVEMMYVDNNGALPNVIQDIKLIRWADRVNRMRTKTEKQWYKSFLHQFKNAKDSYETKGLLKEMY